jgi:hypothetical protein
MHFSRYWLAVGRAPNAEMECRPEKEDPLGCNRSGATVLQTLGHPKQRHARVVPAN